MTTDFLELSAQDCRRIAEQASRGVFSQREATPGTRRVGGYASVFYNPRDHQGTTYMLFADLEERIAASAFDSALRRKDDCTLNFNHDDNFTLARVGAGTLSLSVDSKGLMYEAELRNDPASETVLQAVRRGDVVGASFQFHVLKESYHEDGSLTIRTIQDVELIDCAICTRGAYPSASAFARNILPTGRIGRRTYRFSNLQSLAAELSKSAKRFFRKQREPLSRDEHRSVENSLRVLVKLCRKHKINLMKG